MASDVTAPRGMRDFLPADKARRERVLGVIRESYRRHGFDEIETPVMEDSARLHAGLGGDNEKLAFGVLKRGLTVEDLRAAREPLDLVDLGLRFDLTVPLARFYATHRAELPSVFRAIQIAPVWRAERPQRGRFRQFVQCDIDIIGEPGPLAEVELIAATADALDALGLAGCAIRINDRRILAALVRSWGIADADYESTLVTVDKLDKVGVDGVVAELSAKGLGDAERVGGTLRAIAELPDDGWALASDPPAWLDVAVYRELLAIREALPGIRLVFSPDLVRGMGYYTGTIFEIAHPDVPYSLGGGGRYDGMIGRFLGTDVPAVGFSLGFERILELVEAAAGERADAVALVYDDGAAPARLVALKRQLVQTGARVRLVRRARRVAAQLDQLAAEGFTRFAFVPDGASTAAELEFRELAPPA